MKGKTSLSVKGKSSFDFKKGTFFLASPVPKKGKDFLGQLHPGGYIFSCPFSSEQRYRVFSEMQRRGEKARRRASPDRIEQNPAKNQFTTKKS